MAPSHLEARAKEFSALHVAHDPLIVTNVWDVATASAAAEREDCKALATASYAIAATLGVEDDDLTLEDNLAVAARIAKVADHIGKPLTVDLQSGYGDRLEEAVRRLVEIGVVGCNLEDKDTDSENLYEPQEAAGRVLRVRAAAEEAGCSEFVVNARTDVLLMGGTVEDAIERGRAYLAAGAMTIFVWGGSRRGGMTRAEVEKVTAGLNGRVSVKMNLRQQDPESLTATQLAEIGVARISCGPGLWHAAMAAFRREVDEVMSR